MRAKDVIKGIEEGFDDNEQIAGAVAWVEDAESRLGELLQDNLDMQAEFEAMQAELAALKAVQWRPMDSAPKDGTRILVYAADTKEIFAVSYMTAQEDGSQEWIACRFDGGAVAIRNATHWMPLPTPPQEQSHED